MQPTYSALVCWPKISERTIVVTIRLHEILICQRDFNVAWTNDVVIGRQLHRRALHPSVRDERAEDGPGHERRS